MKDVTLPLPQAITSGLLAQPEVPLPDAKGAGFLASVEGWPCGLGAARCGA